MSEERRTAKDGKVYTKPEFQEWYGEDADTHFNEANPLLASDVSDANPDPASNKYPYGNRARRGVLDFLQQHAGPRAIFGTDLNQSLWILEQEPWKVRQPENGRHGDIVCWRGVSLDLKHIPIGKCERQGVSDAHVMVGFQLHTEFAEARPERAVRPILVARRDVSPTSTSLPETVHEQTPEGDDGGTKSDSDDSDVPDWHSASDDDDEDWRTAEDDEDARSVVASLSRELDGPEGPSDQAEHIQELLRYLWFGNHFEFNTHDAVGRGQKRLAEALSEIRWIRKKYNSAEEPAGDKEFSEAEVRYAHNKYRDSMSWMPYHKWQEYEQLKAQADTGKGKKGNGKNQKAHQLRKGTFNVYIFKRFGCKALFFHFVKVGTTNIPIPALLQQWQQFKTSSEYQDLKKRSVAKSAHEKELKGKRDRLRSELIAKRRHGASKSEIKRLQQQVKDAEALYAETGRPGKRAGVAVYLK